MAGNASSGGRPLPAAIKRLRGNPGKRKVNKAEPVVEAREPGMPEHLPPLAQEEWKAIVPHLLNLGVLSTIDGAALAMYCCCYASAVEAQREIDTHGMLIEEIVYNREGEEVGHKMRRNPAFAMMMEARRVAKSYLTEFGLTPASRARLHIEKPAEPDPLDLYLEEKFARDPQLDIPPPAEETLN